MQVSEIQQTFKMHMMYKEAFYKSHCGTLNPDQNLNDTKANHIVMFREISVHRFLHVGYIKF